MTDPIESLYGPVDYQVFALANQIRLLICDVDGVFSDGRIYLGNDGEELKAFHTRDGFGVKALMHSGIAVAVITGRKSEIVQRRMQSLGVPHIYQGQDDKLAAFDHLLAETGLQPQQCAYIGDDLVDWPVMQRCGLSICVADGHPRLRQQSHYCTFTAGGYGAVREVCDLLMAAQGTLDDAKGTSV